MSTTLRPIDHNDMPFLYQVYAGTRQEELVMVDWTPEQKAAFLDQQFSAQHQYYQEHYHNSRFDIIVWNQVPVGRLYVARWSEEIRIIDIAILPKYRHRGIGTSLLADLMYEASQAGRPLTIHVEKVNPALRLYERLGFQPIDDRGVYWFMEWRPRPTTVAPISSVPFVATDN